jgi:hypothetical protein
MKNLRVFAPLVNGEQMELTDCHTGQEVVRTLFCHDWGAPPKLVVIEATSNDGRVVRLVIQNDESDTVRVAIE